MLDLISNKSKSKDMRDFYTVRQIEANGYLMKIKGMKVSSIIKSLKKCNIDCDKVKILSYNQDSPRYLEEDLEATIFIGRLDVKMELELIGEYEILNSHCNLSFVRKDKIVEFKISDLRRVLKSIFGDKIKLLKGSFNILATMNRALRDCNYDSSESDSSDSDDQLN